MTNSNLVQEKAYQFAKDSVALGRSLIEQKKEFILSKQLVRSGTSICANIEEAQFAQTKKDFSAKMQISLKEAGESKYWLRLLRDTGYLTAEDVKDMLEDIDPIIKILVSILKSSKQGTE